MYSNDRTKIYLIAAVLCVICLIAGVFCLPIEDAYAFWTYSKPGDERQHMHITQLMRYPSNELFLKYWHMMGRWSEEPDAGKNALFGHGDELFRGNQSLDAALDHYRAFLKNRNSVRELQIAAQCLGHAYHYYEDVADFSEGNVPLRRAVSAQLVYLRNNYQWTRTQIENRKRTIQPNRNDIIRILRQIKHQRMSNKDSGRIRDALITIVASLEQMNIFFLHAVNQQRFQQPATNLPTGRCRRECIQWREIWKNISDGRHSLCAGGVPRPPGPGLLPPKCELSRECIRWGTRCR